MGGGEWGEDAAQVQRKGMSGRGDDAVAAYSLEVMASMMPSRADGGSKNVLG